jgi:hypothetical protein
LLLILENENGSHTFQFSAKRCDQGGKAVAATGLPIASVKINPQTGEIKVEMGISGAQDSTGLSESNEWDRM